MYEENMMTVTKSDLSAENSNAKTQNSNQETQNSNGDLIYRDDALKPFCVAPDGTRIPEVDCDNFPVEFSVEFIKKHLLSLPSAEAEWIPCSERLPEKYTYTLWCASSGYVRSDYFNGEFWEDAKKYCYEVIAWMPLPKAYSEVEE